MTQINSAPIRFLEQFEISLFITFRKTWMWNKVGLGFLYVDISSLFLLQDWSWTHVGKGWIGSINGEYIFLFPALVLQLFFNSIPSLINRHSMIPIRTIYFEIRWHTFVDKLRTNNQTFFSFPRSIKGYLLRAMSPASWRIEKSKRGSRSTDFSEMFLHEERRGGERSNAPVQTLCLFVSSAAEYFFRDITNSKKSSIASSILLPRSSRSTTIFEKNFLIEKRWAASRCLR